MLSPRPLLTLLLALTPVACGGSMAGTSATKAAIGAGAAVAVAGINRAVSNECWAACRPGMVCNHASGLCVEQGSAHDPIPRTHPLEDVIANPAGREYEVPALSAACEGDAGACGDAASADPRAR
jgi:hypothetical protein